MKRHLILPVLLVFLTSCYTDQHGTVGAIFQLSDDSPLPSWVRIPEGVSRDQIGITIISYEPTTTATNKVRFEVRDKHRLTFQTIQEETGYGHWHPQSLREKSPAGTFPNWTIMEVKGTKEVYEQTKLTNVLRIVKKPLD